MVSSGGHLSTKRFRGGKEERNAIAQSLLNINIELLQQNVCNTLFDRNVEERIAKGTERVIEAHRELIERLIKEEFIEDGELIALFKHHK